MKMMQAGILAALLCAPLLQAQAAPPKPGDLIPRAGTLSYAVSDRPEALYHVLGRDDEGQWRLRSFFYGMMRKEFEGREDSDEAQGARSILDYVFNSYESVQRAELGLLDVTMDGPKYVLLLHAREGTKIDPAPEFLADFVAGRSEFQGHEYLHYRVPGSEEEGSPNMFGMDRYYVASMAGGLIVSNFESSMRDVLERAGSGDYSESLSGRPEFKEWMENRTPHDLSLFVIAREVQNAIERVLPAEQAETYREVDGWLNLREYRYLVMDFDYDAASRGFTLAGSFKTRRQTPLLEKLAIEPAEFKLRRYLPADAVMTGGAQLGDAQTTFNNLKELAYDVERWAAEIMGPMGGGPREAWPEEFPEPMPPPPPEDGSEPRSVNPLDLLKALSQMGEDGEEEAEDAPPGEVEQALAQLDEALGEYGTSLEEILGVIGSEIVFHVTPDFERAKANMSGPPGISDPVESASMGVVIGLKDVEKAREIIAKARELDSEGAFRGFEAVEHGAYKLNVSTEHEFGWAITDGALLICGISGLDSEDSSEAVMAGLAAMLDASRTTGGGDAFLARGSKYFHMNLGALAVMEAQLAAIFSERLDRWAQPAFSSSPTAAMNELQFSMRSIEHKDGVEVALRLTGMPDLWRFIDGDLGMFGGGGAGHSAYNYGETNLRTLGMQLQNRAHNDASLDLEAMLESGAIRAGVLQLATDARWQGDVGTLGWVTLDQVTRDENGELPMWVDAEAAAMIEANEKEGFRSIKLAEGDIASWIKEGKEGFIVAMQEKPDTMGGHMLLYANGDTGWLHAKVLAEALKLNADGKPVPAAGYGGISFPEDWDEEDMPGDAMPPDEE